MRDHPNAILVKHCYDAFAVGEAEVRGKLGPRSAGMSASGQTRPQQR